MRNFLDLTRWLVLGLGLVTAFVCPAAHAAPGDPAMSDGANPGQGADQSLGKGVGLTAALGVRADLFRSRGLDPFSNRDGIQQSALFVGYRFQGSEQAGLTLGLEWNHGTTGAAVRGDRSTFSLDRLTVAVEGRFPIRRQLSAFARLAPGLLRDSATLADASAPPGAFGGANAGRLTQTSWVPAADVCGGLALRLVEVRRQTMASMDFWLTAAGGYGYAGTHDLVLASRAEVQPGRTDEPVRLGQLALRGPFLRVQLAITF